VVSDAGDALDRIRHTELAAAQKVEEARGRAEEILGTARAEAREIRALAEKIGRERAQKRFDSVVAEAGQEAERIRLEGDEEARRLFDSAPQHIEPISEAMVAAVMAPPREEGK
jgi:vacuolar-type H+-ATPase subunit H